MRNAVIIFAGAAALASWLAPNHYPPWLSFHAEVAMAVAVLLAFVGAAAGRVDGQEVVSPFASVCLVLAAVPFIQMLFGKVFFFGDALLVSAYVTAFVLAQICGRLLARQEGPERFFETVSALLVSAGIASVGLQLCQWLGVGGLGIFMADMPPNGRPYANVAQLNHVATMLVLGVVGVLYLCQREKIGSWTAALACCYLAFGLVMTSSRTAWLEMVVVAGTLIVCRRWDQFRVGRSAAVLLAAGFVALLLAWRPLNDALLLSPGRTLADQMAAGPRILLFQTMWDALLLHPWVGFGWGQGLVAQLAVVQAHPAGGRLIESSHNLVLDLLVWNGIPLGLLICGVSVGWAVFHFRQRKGPAVAFMLCAIAVVFVHAMLEYPLSYLYFLLPVGLLMGAVDSTTSMRGQVLVGRRSVIAMIAASAALLAAITFEYIQIESNVRTLRFELARIGSAVIVSEVPDLHLLTQWGAYLRFVRSEATPAMSEADIATMRKVAERFPYSPALLRYAEANALNGHPDRAAATLRDLCALHGARRCAESLAAWHRLSSESYPQLSKIELPSPGV